MLNVLSNVKPKYLQTITYILDNFLHTSFVRKDNEEGSSL